MICRTQPFYATPTLECISVFFLENGCCVLSFPSFYVPIKDLAVNWSHLWVKGKLIIPFQGSIQRLEFLFLILLTSKVKDELAKCTYKIFT